MGSSGQFLSCGMPSRRVLGTSTHSSRNHPDLRTCASHDTAGFIPAYVETGLTFLTHLSAGNQSLGVSQSHPTSGVHRNLLPVAATFTALPSPVGPSSVGCESLAPGQLGGGKAHSTSGAFCLTHHFPLCPGSPRQPWGHPSLALGPLGELEP